MAVAKDIMNKHIVGVSRTTKITTAIRLVSTSKVNILPVLEGRKLCGMVSESDLNKYSGTNSEIGDIVRKPVFVESNYDLHKVSMALINNRIGRIPVVLDRHSMICIGTISSTDVVKMLNKKR